jgi:diguanylate cyclase (GGDEF)-like protein
MASPLRQITASDAPVEYPTTLNAALHNLTGALQSGSGASRFLLGHALDLVREAETVLNAQRQRIADLERLSATDDLTGLENRRGFMDHLRRHVAAARRHGETGILALCDLDGFKQINDRHGHPAGDAMLRRFAELMRRHVRETDVVGRLGGDEFAILLTRCDIDGGLAKIAALRGLADAGALDWNGETIPVRASFGAIPYRSGAAADKLIAAADAELYSDKARRRVQAEQS